MQDKSLHTGSLVVSSELQSAIIDDLASAADVVGISIRDFLPAFLEEERHAEKFRSLERYVGSLAGKRILEVGAGHGAMVVYGILYHLDMWGLEPPHERFEGHFEIAQRLLLENGILPDRIRCGVGEAIPFADGAFDLVFSFQVLEHVRDPRQVLAESWRVLKPGGSLFCQAPNYRTFFEGHYNVPWPPGMPKWMAKGYLRLIGRNPEYLNHINFLNQPQLQRWLDEICGFRVQSDFGLAQWRAKLGTPSISPYTQPNIARWIRIGQRLGLFPLMATLGGLFKWQEPLEFAIVKPGGMRLNSSGVVGTVEEK